MVTNFTKQTSSIPLATYRVVFGLMMLISILRFFYYGWIDTLYIQPRFFFSYYGFEWVKPLGLYTYGLFALAGLSTFGIILGYRFKISLLTFFLSFTYIQLMDKTYYLNHYYFISLVCFLMLFLPMNATYSWDAKRKKSNRSQVPVWTKNALKLLIGVVYFYAGLCKLNSDWLVDAMPLKIWLSSKYYIPIVGSFTDHPYAPYLFSWLGAAYDLSIPFLLLSKKTRGLAFVSVVVFHVLTRLLFPIGMFPFIMIGGAFIYFSDEWHQKIWTTLSRWIHYKNPPLEAPKQTYLFDKRAKFIVAALLIIHLLFPWRYLLYPGELFWTEEGFRYSWRVMLMEKAGYTLFRIKDPESQRSITVNNLDFLTPMQEKQMSFQPDFILSFAHYLKKYYQDQHGIQNPEVYVESFVSLNGRRPKRMIDPTVDLGKEKESFAHKTWILPFDEKIKGL